MKKSSFLQNSKDLISRSFNPSKCKTSLRLASSRLKLLKNKKQVQLTQMKREVAQLIQSGQDRTARIRVEHVIREEKMMAAFDLIEIYCEIIVARLPIIESQKNCPSDLKEAISSVLFASPRCGDVPELLDVRKHFTAKYGKDFTNAAIELRPACGVSHMLIEKLSATAPDGQAKNKILSAIAKEHNVDWDPKSFEEKDLLTSSDLLNGPNASRKESKVHAEPSRMEYPVAQATLRNNKIDNSPSNFSKEDYRSSVGSEELAPTQTSSVITTSHPSERPPALGDGRSKLHQGDSNTIPPNTQRWNMEFKDATAAAQAAAESAERASMAARAAAEFSMYDRRKNQYSSESHEPDVYDSKDEGPEFHRKSKLPSEKGSSSERTRLYNEKIDDIQESKLKTAGNGASKEYIESASLNSKASTDVGVLNQGVPVLEGNSRKNSSKEGSEGEINFKYEAESANGLPEKSENTLEERTGNQHSVDSSHYHSSISDDVNIFATSNDTKFGYESDDEPFVVTDKQEVHEQASENSSHDSSSIFVDKFDSDTDDTGFDIGPTYDEPEFHYPWPGRESPEHLSFNTDSWRPNSSSIKVENSTPSLFSTRKNSSPDFSENMTSVNGSELENFMPVTFDESDGPASESDEDNIISRHTKDSRDFSSENSKNGQSTDLQFSDELRHPVGSFIENGYSAGLDKQNVSLSSDDELNSDHKMYRERNQREKNDAESPEKISPEKLSAGHPNDQMEPSDLRMELSPDTEEGMNLENLTSASRHKDYNHPPMKNRFDESSVLEETITTTESPKKNSIFDLMKNSRTPEPYSDDNGSSEEEEEVSLPRHPGAAEEIKPKLNLRVSNSFFGSDNSDLEDDAPKKELITRKNHIQSGISRRTKAAPSSSATNSYYRMQVSNAGIIDETPKESHSEKRDSSQWDNYEQPSSEKVANKPLESKKFGPPEKYQERFKSAVHDPEAGGATKPSSSKTQEKFQSTQRTNPLGNLEHPTSANSRSDILEPPSSIQGSKIFQESSELEEPSRKTEALFSSENPRATTNDKTHKEGSSKKERHVHPKLPDYDTLVQSLRMNR